MGCGAGLRGVMSRVGAGVFNGTLFIAHCQRVLHALRHALP